MEKIVAVVIVVEGEWLVGGWWWSIEEREHEVSIRKNVAHTVHTRLGKCRDRKGG